GPANREEHHVVPRAYGGTDGPLVSLCDGHHTALHKIAVALKSNKPYHQHLTRDPEQDQKLMYLATVVVNAQAATTGDPNKKTMVVVSLDGVLAEKLKRLSKMYPQVGGRAALVKLAIESLYSKHFY